MNRRVLLQRIVKGFSITGFAFFSYPFFKAWIPSFGEALSMDVDTSEMKFGEQRVVHWLGRNIILVKRDPDVVEALADTQDDLKDPLSIASDQPAEAKNIHRSLRPDLFVAFTNCTHLGCEIEETEQRFKCPCHQSDFDPAGRVLSDAAAPRNLDIPHYRYLSRNIIRLEKADA